MEPRRTSTGTRLLLGLGVGTAAILLIGVSLATAAIVTAGEIAVDVERDQGHSFRLSVPAVLVNLAIALAPTDAIHEAARELEPALPALLDAFDEIESSPDFAILTVERPGDRISVHKRAGRIEVELDWEDEQVHVSVPLNTLGKLLRKI